MDRDRNGYISEAEDGEALKIDRDGDRRVALWEIMREANDRAEGPRKIFARFEIRGVKESIQNIPSISPGNIAHVFFAMGRRFTSRKGQNKAYRIFSDLMNNVKREALSGLTPQAKLEKVHEILGNASFKPKKCQATFIKGVVADIFPADIHRRRYECRSISFIYLCVAQEMGWPVSLVHAPHHLFVRWEEPGISFYFEATGGMTMTSDDYVRYFSITEENRARGVYLKSLSEKEALAFAYLNRSVVSFAAKVEDDRWIARHLYDDLTSIGFATVLRDVNNAIDLYPDFAYAHFFRNRVYKYMGKSREAKKSLAKARQLDTGIRTRKLPPTRRCVYFRGRLYPAP